MDLELFSGNALSVVDAKGRMSLPSSFRAVVASRMGLPGDANGAVLIGEHKLQPCLQGFDKSYQKLLYTRLQEEVAKSGSDSFSDDLDERFAETFGNPESVSYDGVGRMVLPLGLREFAGLDAPGSVALITAAADTFRIWNLDKYRAAYADKPNMLRIVDRLKDPRK